MKKFGLATLALATAAFASPLTWERLIQSIDDDPRYQTAQKRAEMTSSGRSAKLWDKLELRYKLDGFSFASHDFELRFTPKAFGEGAADREHWDAQAAYQKAHLAADRGVLLYDRYARGIHYLLSKRMNLLNKELYQVNLDRIEVLHLKSGSPNFNPQELMDAIEKDTDLRADLVSDSSSLEYFSEKLKVWVLDFDSIDLDSTWLPSIDEVIKQLEGGVMVDESYPLIAMASQKMREDKSKARQDYSKDRDYISHIGIGYSLQIESLMEKYKELDASDVWGIGSYKDYQSEFTDKTGCTGIMNCTATANILVPDQDNRKTADKFFVNLGFRLPFFDSNKDGVLRVQVADLDAEGDYMEEVRDVSQKVAKLVEEVNSLISQWKVQKEFIEQVSSNSIFEQFAKNAGSDPLLRLRARESAINSTIKATKLENEIYDRYLAILQYAGVLSQEGVVNHLQKGLK